MKKKKSKGLANQPKGIYKRFLLDVYDIVVELGMKNSYCGLTLKDKQFMFKNHHWIKSAVAGNEHITSKEVKKIDNMFREQYRQRIYDFLESKISCYQLWLLRCFYQTAAQSLNKEEENSSYAMEIQECAEMLMKFYMERLFDTYLKVIVQFSNPDIKYYGVDIAGVNMNKEKSKIEIDILLFGLPAEKCMLSLNGHYRPAFKLAGQLEKKMEWLSLDTQILGEQYKGSYKELDVYIQSHALQRLRERLDLLDQETVNYTLWLNTQSMEKFEMYNNYFLLPFNLYDIKVGYLAAKIIENKLLIRTFLFVTHSCTPEGDRLKNVTGLQKQDIKYWRVDRLSTFIGLDEQKYPELIRLFDQVGLSDLSKLKEKEFSVESMQTANLDGLMDYLMKNVNISKAFEELSGVDDEVEIV